MAKQPTTELSAIEELVQLERRRDELRNQLRGEAHAALRQSLETYNSLNLGTTYELREVGAPRTARQIIGDTGSRKGTRSVNADRPCPICGFKTIPPHDARAHRSQGGNKRPFTAEELDARGMRKA